MEAIGNKIVLFYDFGDKFNYLGELYQHYDAWAVGVAGFYADTLQNLYDFGRSIPHQFPGIFIGLPVSRSARFFLVGGLIYWLGPR